MQFLLPCSITFVLANDSSPAFILHQCATVFNMCSVSGVVNSLHLTSTAQTADAKSLLSQLSTWHKHSSLDPLGKIICASTMFVNDSRVM